MTVSAILWRQWSESSLSADESVSEERCRVSCTTSRAETDPSNICGFVIEDIPDMVLVNIYVLLVSFWSIALFIYEIGHIWCGCTVTDRDAIPDLDYGRRYCSVPTLVSVFHQFTTHDESDATQMTNKVSNAPPQTVKPEIRLNLSHILRHKTF